MKGEKAMASNVGASSQLSIASKEALFTSNALLASGSVIAPAVVVATGFMPAVTLCLIFSIVTYITVAICSFVPRKLLYTVRIILYTLVASLVYVPVSLLVEGIMPQYFAALGIYAPLLITNSMITVRTESKFYRLKRGYMFELAAFYVIGYDISLLLFGTLREMLSNGGLFGASFLPLAFPTASTVFGGFILLAVISAVFRWAIRYALKKGAKAVK